MRRVLKWGCLGVVGLFGVLIVGFVAIAIFAPPPTDKEMRQFDKQVENASKPAEHAASPDGPETPAGRPSEPTGEPARSVGGLRITNVTDGDTFEISEEVEGTDTVRLIGVDAPEEGGPCGEQPLAQDATWFLESYEGQPVRLELDEDTTDQYGRLLAYAHVDTFGQKLMLNEELLLEGLAQVYTVPPNDRYEDRLLEAQQKARSDDWNIISVWTLSKAEKAQLEDHGNGIGTENLEQGACPSSASASATASPSPAPNGGDGDPDRDRGVPGSASPAPSSPEPGGCPPPSYRVPPGDERDGDGDGCAGEV